jgi:uncharacterized protein (DUF2062 family)
MPRHLFRKYLPSHESVRANRLVARFGHLLHHPMLWCLNRRSVAGGVAVGLFSGLVPGPLQMLTAALLAVPLKVNLPIALGTTLYTNPFTIGPLYFLAYGIGTLIIPGEAAPSPAPAIDWTHLGMWLESFVHWLLSMGKPLALGLVLLAVGLAVLGYFAVHIAWRFHVLWSWRRRRVNRPENR